MRIKLIVSCLSFLTLFTGNITFAQNATSASNTPAPKPPVATTAPSPAPRPAVAATQPGTATTTTAVVHYRPKAPVEKPVDAPIPGPVWKKQITRDVEMGEKIDSNVHRLRDASPNNTLLEMFAIGIKTGRISSFYTSEFSMATRINVRDFGKLFVGKPDTVTVRDASGRYRTKIANKDFNYASIHKYRVLEEWTAYPSIGKTEIQIIAIAPLKDIIGSDGANHGVEPIFWVHYTDDIKALLTRYNEYHPNNSLGGHLWDDYFNTNVQK